MIKHKRLFVKSLLTWTFLGLLLYTGLTGITGCWNLFATISVVYGIMCIGISIPLYSTSFIPFLYKSLDKMSVEKLESEIEQIPYDRVIMWIMVCGLIFTGHFIIGISWAYNILVKGLIIDIFKTYLITRKEKETSNEVL